MFSSNQCTVPVLNCDNNDRTAINMDDNEIETYFLWLTEAEQSDLFDYEDNALVSNLICEVVVIAHYLCCGRLF